MLYLFNSAARPEYVKNVLNTLHLPNDAINIYQYETTPYNYVEKFSDIPTENEKVVIFFIDRNDNNHEANKYIPLRFGVLKKKELNQGKVYFYVQLKNFVETTDDHNLQLKSTFSNKIFYKQDEIEHGFLAFMGKEIVSLQNDGNSNNWIDTVQRIMDCSKLKDSNCVYTHLSLYDNKKNYISPICIDKEWKYKIKSSNSYTFKLDYYIPFAKESHNADTIHFSLTESSKNIITPSENTWGVKNGKQEFNFDASNLSKNQNICYELKSSDTSKNIVFSNSNISVILKKSCWFRRTLPFLLFGVSSFISTFIASIKDLNQTDISKNVLDCFANCVSNLNTSAIAAILAICAILEAISLLLIKNSLSKNK